MADSAVTTLQNAINRFAVVGGFPRVSVDGQWGSQTKQGVYSSLAFIGQGKCYQSICPDSETSSTAAKLMASWDESMNAAKGLSEFLNGVANDLGMPLVASPIDSGGLGPIVPSGGIIPVDTAAYGASIIDKFKALPLWQRVLIGAAGALGLIWVVNKVNAPKRKRSKR